MSSRRNEPHMDPAVQSIMDQGQKVPPKDRYNISYVLFYAFGVLSNIPSHFFTTATDYWMFKFRNTNQSDDASDRTELQAQFLSTYSIIANVSTILFVGVTILLAKKIKVTSRIFWPMCGVVATFAITLIFVGIDTDSWQKGFFITTLIVGAILSACSGIFMVTLFQTVGRFPPEYLAAILSGQSICGILAAVIQIFTLGIGTSSSTSGLIYFLIGMLFVLSTLVYFIVALKATNFFRYNMTKTLAGTSDTKITKEFVLRVLNKIKYYLMGMIVVLGASVMTHPGVTGLVTSIDRGNGEKWNDVFFTPVASFLFYYLFDYVGREMAGYFRKPKSPVIILAMACLRIAFVPLIMLCNAQPRSHLPVVFSEDWIYIIFIIIFALSNGFLVNLCALQIPLTCTREEINLALGLLIGFMILSLGLCSFLSALLVSSL